MATKNNKSGFIRTRRAAAIGVVWTGLFAALTFRRVFFSPPHHYHPHWLVDWSFLLPRWALLPLNVAFYAIMVGLCIAVFLEAQGRERALVAGWYPGVLLTPIKMFFPVAVHAVDFLEVIGITIALVESVLIFWEYSGRNRNSPPDGVQGSSLDEPPQKADG